MNDKGFITIHRKLTDWEWYSDIKTKVLFIHLLISVNWECKSWRGITINRGSIITSISHLSAETNLTPQNIRTCLKRLKSTNEITIVPTNKFTLITIVKYDDYQNKDSSPTIKTTNNQHSSNNQSTTTKPLKPLKPLKQPIPAFYEFLEFANLKIVEYKLNVSETDLKMKYESWIENDWMTGGNKPRKILNWKTTLINTLKYLNQKEKFPAKKEKVDAATIVQREMGIIK
jgi:hypothetical protein